MLNSKERLYSPSGDLVQQKNPTCWVETYEGGLSCCPHQTILLDQDQTPPPELLTYHMKFRSAVRSRRSREVT